jgi:hypothetical protein
MRFGRYSIAALVADKGNKHPAKSSLSLRGHDNKLTGEWARALSNTHFFGNA